MSEEKKQKMRCICAGKSAVETVDIPASAESDRHPLAGERNTLRDVAAGHILLS